VNYCGQGGDDLLASRGSQGLRGLSAISVAVVLPVAIITLSEFS